MALTSAPIYVHRQIAQQLAPCLDCTTIADCGEPSCSAQPALTSQCTDQCVVIACDDPDHSASLCDGSPENSRCEIVCEEASNCEDCHSLENFPLQCCDEYHQYPSKVHNMQQPTFNVTNQLTWEHLAELSMWCACGDGSNDERLPSPSDKPVGHSIHHAVHPMKDDNTYGQVLPQVLAPPSNLLSARPSPQLTPSPARSFDTPHGFGCLWGSCQSRFTTFPELIEHVNYYHLSQHSAMPNNSSSPNNQLDTSNPCLWNKCPDSDHFNGSPEALYNHLINGHLKSLALSRDKLSTPSPSSTPSTILQPPQEQILLHDLAEGPPPQQDSQPDDVTHHCHWKNCGYVFQSYDSLTAHITTEHIGGGQAYYECFWEGCNRNGNHGFQSKQKICRHVQSHTGYRPFQCHICTQNFSEAATLQQHIRRHTREKPYVCDHPGCGKSFAITGALTIHKRTHNGDKPFKCTFCDRGFAESSNLSKHLRTHTGARPYVCTEPGCTKAFSRPDQLTRHKGVHRKHLNDTVQLSSEL